MTKDQLNAEIAYLAALVSRALPVVLDRLDGLRAVRAAVDAAPPVPPPSEPAVSGAEGDAAGEVSA